MVIDGFLETTHPLSPRSAFSRLDRKIQRLVCYTPQSVWEHDTKLLPQPLRVYRRQAKDFADRIISPHVLDLDLDPHDNVNRRVLLAAAQEGYLSDLLPWPLGSAAWRVFRQPLMLVQSLKLEEFSTTCAGMAVLLGAHVLGAAPLFYSGDFTLIRRFLLPAMRRNRAGEPYIFAYAITEPAAGSDVEDSAGAAAYQPQTWARRVEGGWLINGRKIFISGGDSADAVTVFAALEGEGMDSWTCFLVEKGRPGFSIVRTELKMGQRASHAAELVFEDVYVPDDHVIGGLRSGWAINRAVLSMSRVPVGAVALGIARGALEHALNFVCHHKLAGKPLIDYQDVQLTVAQMMIDTAAMRALVWQAGNTWVPVQARSSMTKVFCSDTAVRVCETAMELLGNHAVLHRNYVEKHFRDARLTQIYEGTNQINRLAIIEDQLETLEKVLATDSPEGR